MRSGIIYDESNGGILPRSGFVQQGNEPDNFTVNCFAHGLRHYMHKKTAEINASYRGVAAKYQRELK